MFGVSPQLHVHPLHHLWIHCSSCLSLRLFSNSTPLLPLELSASPRGRWLKCLL
jgi:hypothetical protein